VGWADSRPARDRFSKGEASRKLAGGTIEGGSRNHFDLGKTGPLDVEIVRNCVLDAIVADTCYPNSED
jgi:hypothetical protein